jgi:protein TonB
MKETLLRSTIASLLPLFFSVGSQLAWGSQTLKSVTVHETYLRKRATKTVTPGFPEQAKKRGAKGVVVAQLNVNERGEVARVEVLEAPDPLIKEAVIKAIEQWRFNPPTISGKPVRIRGKLTFYYVIERGKGRVDNPRQFNQAITFE